MIEAAAGAEAERSAQMKADWFSGGFWQRVSLELLNAFV
jgi:hypothetical protein